MAELLGAARETAHVMQERGTDMRVATSASMVAAASAEL